jgi:hypothetical protein
MPPRIHPPHPQTLSRPTPKLRPISQCLYARPIHRSPISRRRLFYTRGEVKPPSYVNLNQAAAQEAARFRKKAWLSGAGVFVTAVATVLIAFNSGVEPTRLDAGVASELSTSSNNSVVVKTGTEDGIEQIPTGTSTIPYFPKTLLLDNDKQDSTPNPLGKPVEYQLMGLGVRTVSFLGIQVYVVGMYVATEDIAALQRAMVRRIDDVATTLVKNEKEKLKQMLLDPEDSEEIWGQVLRDTRFRTAVRIVPTRNTDFMHLRDGWVRGITARVQNTQKGGEGGGDGADEAFGQAVGEFKGVFSGGKRKSVPKGKTLLLLRGLHGELEIWYDGGDGKGEEGMVKMGGVQDERIGRQIWMGYLAGKSVASESARKSIVDGVLDFVGRPVGTIAAQVV